MRPALSRVRPCLTRRVSSAFAALVVLLALALPARAQDGRAATFTAVRTATPPAIDGRGDDPAWRDAPVATGFHTYAPREDAEPEVATDVRVVYDDRALYVLVRAHDAHPEGIIGRLARRDNADQTSDQVGLFISPAHDGRNGVEFLLNAAGVKTDGLIIDDGTEDPSWDGVWDGAASVDSAGWTAEFAIPFDQMRFAERRAPTFGMSVARGVGRTGERSSLPGYHRSRAGLASQLGTLAGLRDLARSAGLLATPYALTRAENRAPTAARAARIESRASVGGDVRWLPRPAVSVDATFNPDFGQVEADPAALDLTGTEVLQTERRPFFLEGAGLFAFPLDAEGRDALFYSRRVGRRPALLDAYGDVDAPTETTILGAAKATVLAGPSTSVAVLAAATQQERGEARAGAGRPVLEPAAEHVVARVQSDRRRGRSSIGLMLTDVERHAGDATTRALLPRAARAAALTTQHQTNDGAYRVSAWGAASEVRGDPSAIALLQLSPVHALQRPDGEVAYDSTRRALSGGAAALSAGKVGGGITRFDLTYRWLDPRFDVNESGYLARADMQQASASVGLKSRRPGRVLGVAYRSATTTLAFAGDWSAGGLTQARALMVSGVMQLPSLVQLNARAGRELPGAYCTVVCTRGGPALVDPPATIGNLEVTGDPRRPLVPHASLQLRRDDEGRSRAAGGQVDAIWRPRSNVELWLAGQARDDRIDAQFYARFGEPTSDTAHYTVAALARATRSVTARASYTMSTRLSVQWYAQAFVSRGTFSDVRELANPRAPRYDDRFRPYGDPAVVAQPGGIDFKQLRSNTVLRWEYRPGSAVFVVWAQARDFAGNAPGRPPLWPGADLRELFGLHPANTVIVKASHLLRT